MNKKFSTLAASLLLASAFTTVSAQLKVGDCIRLEGGSSNAIAIDASTGLTEVSTTASLPSSTGTNEDAIIEELKETQSQVWKVAKITVLATGDTTFQFVNKLTNEYLAVDLATATDGGATAALNPNGNKDWVWTENGSALKIYVNSKDSVYTLSSGSGNVKITRTKGKDPKGGLTVYKPADNTTFKASLDYGQFNALMNYPGNDGKLHFNGDKNVTTGEDNILTANKYVAYKDNKTPATKFFLAKKDTKTPVGNPYLLMVGKDQYAPELDQYYKFAIDTLAIEGSNVSALIGNTWNSNTHLLNGSNASYKGAVGTATFKADYYFVNDSIALSVDSIPTRYRQFDFAITDGTSAWSTMGIDHSAVDRGGDDAVIDSANVKVVKALVAQTAHKADVDSVRLAVEKWITEAVKDEPTAAGYNRKFANAVFGTGGFAFTGITNGTGTGADIIARANKVATTDAEKAYLAAVAKLERKLIAVATVDSAAADTTTAYIQGMPTKKATGGTFHPVITQLSSTKVLTVAPITTGYIKPLVQPFEKATTGDAEITANAGLFFMKVENSTNALRAASLTRYVVDDPNAAGAPYDYQESVDETNPYAQWVFIPNATGSYSIVNRGTGNPYYSGMVSVVKDEAGNVVADTYVIKNDTLKLAAVTLNTDNVYTEGTKQYDYSGYFYAGPQNGKTMSFAIAPVSPFMSSLAMQVQADSTVVLGEAENAPIWYFDQVDGETYGATIAGVPQLKSVGYKVYMKDENGVKYYIVANTTAGVNKFVITKEDSRAASAISALYFRTVAKDTYMIYDASTGSSKMTINPTPAQPIIEATGVTSMKNDYFTVGKSSVSHYRTLTAEDGVNGNAAIYLNNENSRYLYENTANIVANNGTKFAKDSLNFLGIFNAFELDKNPTVYVDTAYVDRAGNIMPQYMFALGVEDVEAQPAIPCTEGGVHIDKDGKPTTADKCVHATAATNGYKAGRYLVLLTDSTENKSAKYDGAPRFAFVPAKHYLGEDSLVIDNSKYAGTTNAKNDTLKIADNALNVMTFALLIKDQADQSFYLETKGGYVRILNGVPVHTTSKDDAAIFNIEASELEATANEAIEAAGIQVIGGQGVVTVQGAAGKVITVANILGQTIANQVATSDNVTIAAPAGVVVVAVDGEATKVVVK